VGSDSPVRQTGGGAQVADLIAAIVLAAGRSARLGRAKQLLELEGRPLLQHVIDAVAESSVDEIIVVLGHEAKRIERSIVLPPHARVVVNPLFAQGQSTSVKRGLDAVGRYADAAVFLVGDQPRIRAGIIDRVIQAWRETSLPVARAYFNGTPGHPVVVARSNWDAFKASRGDAGGRKAMDAGGVEVLEVEFEMEPLDDIDTWADFHRVERGS
jgi:molybdenum cofactor cytidylyltransferase